MRGQGGFPYEQVRRMPINLRRFFINEIIKEDKKSNKKDEEEPLSETEKSMIRSQLAQGNNALQQKRSHSDKVLATEAPGALGSNKQNTNASEAPKRLMRFKG